MFMKYTASEKEFDFTQKDMLSIRKSIEEELKITQTECRAQPQTCGIELNFFLILS